MAAMPPDMARISHLHLPVPGSHLNPTMAAQARTVVAVVSVGAQAIFRLHPLPRMLRRTRVPLPGGSSAITIWIRLQRVILSYSTSVNLTCSNNLSSVLVFMRYALLNCYMTRQILHVAVAPTIR